jgi:hypothetical protein
MSNYAIRCGIEFSIPLRFTFDNYLSKGKASMVKERLWISQTARVFRPAPSQN